MKIPVSKILHFQKAAHLVAKYVTEQSEGVAPSSPEGMKLAKVGDACTSILRMADALLEAEVTVKG